MSLTPGSQSHGNRKENAQHRHEDQKEPHPVKDTADIGLRTRWLTAQKHEHQTPGEDPRPVFDHPSHAPIIHGFRLPEKSDDLLDRPGAELLRSMLWGRSGMNPW